MTTAMTQKVIEIVEQLPPDKLQAALSFLEALASDRNASSDATLLQIIQQSPAIDQVRLTDLRHRCEWGKLTPAEQQELIAYEDQLETYNVDRLQAMMQLAQLRNIDLPTLNQQLKASA